MSEVCNVTDVQCAQCQRCSGKLDKHNGANNSTYFLLEQASLFIAGGSYGVSEQQGNRAKVMAEQNR
jgi:hypothetical protein